MYSRLPILSFLPWYLQLGLCNINVTHNAYKVLFKVKSIDTSQITKMYEL